MRILLVLVLLATACAPRTQNMALDLGECADCRVDQAYKNQIDVDSIKVSTIARATLESLPFSEQSFTDALRESLDRYDVLGPDGAASPYSLDIEIVDVLQPENGLTMTARVVIRYALYRTADRRLIHEAKIESQATRKLSDSLLVLERSRLSLEGAIRNNFRGFISTL